MARAAVATKSKKKPADFKRPKRKVGRRAAPAANVTSVGITSRRINLLEQSLLQDKAGAAQLTHRRQALPELLQQTGHYNAHVRQRALQGLKELATQETAANLRANASVLLERFLPTLLDEEAVVREAAVQAWKAMLPVLRSVLAPFATLVATYFCSGLTHLQVGVRQDALKAIGELVDEAPELLREDAGREALARLLENFRDLICAAQTQGIRMMNTYDLLLGNDAGAASKKAANGRKSQKNNQKKSKKPKAPSGALALRFAALKVLHKLLQSVSTQVGDVNWPAGVRSANVPTTKALLLYPAPRLVDSGMFAAASATTSAGEKVSASWQEKVRALLPALLDLWLESLEGSTDALSDVHVEHMKYIVECSTAVVGANTDLLNVDLAEDTKKNEFFHAALKLREELLAPESFPMLPSASATLAAASDSQGALSRWHGMNAALAKLACEYLRLPALMRDSGKGEEQSESLEQRVCAYVVTTLVKYKETAELRAVASMQNVLQPLLEVVTLILASTSKRSEPSKSSEITVDERSLLLDAVTEFYVLCTPKSVSFRSCTTFAVGQLEIALRGQQRQSQMLPWPMVMKWVVCLADLLGQLDPQHMDLGRRSLLSLISVLKQLPTEFASGDQMDGVLTNLSAFFDLATVPAPSMSEDEKQRMMARTRFDALGAADQLAFVALVYHLPRYPVSLLRALASCCKSPRIYSEAKSFLVDIVFQRRDAVDLAHIVSFLVSTALAPVEANAHHQRQQLHLVDHVCHTFVAMNLGSSLPKILAPTLAKAQAREEMNSVELHTLVLLYRTCVLSASTRSVETHNQRSDIPSEMERELVSLAVKVMVNFAVSSSSEQSTTPEEIDAREQERLLVDSCVSTLVLGETNVFAAFLNELLAVQQQVVTATRLRVLQALVRTSSLAGAFRRHQSHVGNLLRGVEQKYSGDDDDAQTLRQLRGDLELLAVGELTDGGSKISFTKASAVAVAALGECNMKPRSWIKTMAASSLLSPRAAFRKANSTPSSHTTTKYAVSKVSIPLAMLTTLTRVIEFLDDNHFEEEGLYSKPGVGVECKDLLSFFHDQKLPDLTAYNPHSIASAVKEILSNLYTPMISVDTSEALLEAVGSGRIDEAAERKITEIFKQIRSTTRDFLQVFLGHLNHVSSNSQSRMSVTNLALHVGIALIRPTEDKTILSSKTMMRQRKCIAEFFIRQAASLPYDCATEMNIPAIPELAPAPLIDPLDSSFAPLSLKQLHFVQVTWDAGESTFTPEKLEEIFAKFGEIENLGINDQGNRAIISYMSAASAKEAERASIPFVRVRRRKPRQSEKRREYSPRSVKSISSDFHLNRDAKDNLPTKQAVTLLQQGTSAVQQREIPSSLAPKHSPVVHEPEPKVLDDSIIVEDIEDDEQQPPEDSSVMLATDLHFDDSTVLSSTSSNDLQVTTDSNDADVGFSMQENDNSQRLIEFRSPNVAVTPVQAEQDTPATEIGGDLESKLADGCLCTDSETKTIAQDIVPVAKEQDDDHDNVGDFPPTNERRTGSQQLPPETESSLENLPLDTLSAVSAGRSQGKCLINSVEPIQVKHTVVENYLDRVNGPDPIRHSLNSLESSMKSIDLPTDQDEPLNSADNAIVMDALQSKLLDMDKILSTSTAALSMAKLSTEFERAVLQLHNQILDLVADCLVLAGAKHGDLSDISMINTTTNAEFLDFLEAQSKTQVKILEVEVRAGQELLRLHKTQFEKERIELEEEITALRVGRTETEKLCAELRSDLRKCRCELACHVANATDIQRQKSALEEKLVVSENQLHAGEKALAKLQAEYEKMHRVAAEAQARVEKFKMGDFSGGKTVPDNQEEYHGFQSSSDGKPASNIVNSSLQHVTKFMSKHAIRANAAIETVPAEEKSPSTPEVLPRTSNVAALEAMKQRMTRDIQEQLASTRAALKEMEICSSSGKTLEEEEEELRQLQKQFAARSSEMDAAMSESRAKLQELLSPAGHLSSHGDRVGFEEPKSNQEPTIFDSTALVNQLIAQAEEGSTNTFQKRWHHGDSAPEEFFSSDIQHSVRNFQPAHEAQSSLYKKWTADRSRKMEKLASYRDKHAVLQAQKSMQTFQQTLAEMRGQS